MSTTLRANEVWQGTNTTLIDVQGVCQYRVMFDKSEAHVVAPGLDVTVELDEDIHPLDDLEATAIMIIAQLEGGLEL